MVGPSARAVPDDIRDVDLTDPRTFAEHGLTDFWRMTRSTWPVYWHPPGEGRDGFWVLSRYADIASVYRNDRSFTSVQGNVLESLLGSGDPAAGRVLELTDGDRHREVRKILSKALSPQVLKGVATRVRENSHRLLTEAVDRGDCDFADDASKISINTIGNLLGVPEKDHEFLLDLTSKALSTEEPDSGGTDTSMARHGLMLYFSDLVDDRRGSPGDDVISMLANCEIGGERMGDDEIVLNCYSLVLGNETNRLSMIDAVFTLDANRDQWRALRDGVVPVERAVEEVLRWSSPTMHFARTVTEEVDVAGTRMAPGDVVTLWNVSANRDETVFPDPDRFDLNRWPNRHLTFGHGPHFCVGAYLARVEVAAMLTALRACAADFEVIGPVRRIYSTLLTGISHLPLRFHAAQS